MIVNMQELAGLLRQVKTIAVLGAVDKPGRPVDMVGRYLIEAGYEVIPVHPKRTGVWGLTTYKSLADIPVPVDLVDVFRAPQYAGDHAREVLAMDPLPKAFWMQSGIDSQEARAILAEAPITVVADRCLKVDHQALADRLK